MSPPYAFYPYPLRVYFYYSANLLRNQGVNKKILYPCCRFAPLLLSIFHSGRFVLGLVRILLGVLLVLAAAIFAILGLLLLEAYVLLFLGVTFLLMQIVLTGSTPCAPNKKNCLL